AETTGQNDRCITEFIHFFLSYVHVISDDQFSNAMMLPLPFNKNMRNDADNISLVLHDRISNSSHEPGATATIDHLNILLGHHLAQLSCMDYIHIIDPVL